MNIIECVVFCVRSHQIPLLFERPRSGDTFESTRVRRAENAGFRHSSKSAFSTSASISRRCVMPLHRLVTASVSYGGLFFLLLPSCVLRSIRSSKTKNSRFLSPGGCGQCTDRAIYPVLKVCFSFSSMGRLLSLLCFAWIYGVLCILYGVGLTTTCPLVEALFPHGFLYFLALRNRGGWDVAGAE
jgi:hypothetical protein